MTQEELARLSPEERQRLEAAEQVALDILNRRLREGRSVPRRHMRFALFVFFAVGAIGLFVFGIAWLLTRL
jgi:hypothetical protein